MAQSFIDKYVFALMLDSSNFEKGANVATKAANGIKNTMLKTYSIVGGIDLFKNMLMDYTETTRSIDNLNLITGENITTLQAWKKSIQDVGGNVGAFEGTLKGLSNSLADLRQFGKYDDRLGILGWRGISLYDNGRMKNATELLSEVAKKIKGMNEADAFSWARALGIDESTYRLFRLHGDNIDNLIKKNKQWAVLNREDVKTLRQYDRIVSDFKNSWLSLSRVLVSSVLPVLQKDIFPEIEKLVLYLTDHKAEISDFFSTLAKGAIAAGKGFVQVGEGLGIIAASIQDEQEQNVKQYGKFGTVKTVADIIMDTFSGLFGRENVENYTKGALMGPFPGMFYQAYKGAASINEKIKNNSVYINSLNVTTNDPEKFADYLSGLAEKGSNPLPSSKLDLIPQIGVNVSSL